MAYFSRARLRNVGLSMAAAAAFSCAAPMREGPRTMPDVNRTLTIQDIPVSGNSGARLDMDGQAYRAEADPFGLDSVLRSAVDDAMSAGTDARARVERLFALLHAGPQGRMPVLDMSGRPPRTAPEALSSGGDCTDLANVALGGIAEMNRRGAGIQGGAMVVHFSSRPQTEHHMVPYVMIDGRETVFDLQTSRLGDIAQHTVILRMSFAEAASIYHGEAGDYFMANGRETEAATAYEAALRRFTGDMHVLNNLAAIYQRQSDLEARVRVLEIAARVDPGYGRHLSVARYRLEFGRGERAHREGRMADCAAHFRNARNVLTSQHPYDAQTEAQELSSLDNNIRICGGSSSSGTTITSPD